MTKPKLLTRGEAAAELRVSVPTLDRMIRRGHLPAHREPSMTTGRPWFVRIRASDLRGLRPRPTPRARVMAHPTERK